MKRINIFGMIVISVFITSLSIAIVSAQLEPVRTIKIYEYCNDVVLDDLLYLDGKPLSYDTTGCPTNTIIIHDWQNILDTDKVTIDLRLTTAGYVEGDLLNADTGEVIILAE